LEDSVVTLIRALVAGVFLLTGVCFARDAVVLSPTVNVYEKPDFDSKVIKVLKKGTKVQSSTRLFGPFFKIQFEGKKIGFVPDADLTTPEKIEKILNRERPYALTKWWGLNLGIMRFRENTMGMRPTEDLNIFGFKWTGPDLLISGAITSEINLNFTLNAPKYYETATGYPATGYLLHSDFLLLTPFIQSPRVMTFFGFGPVIKYSSFRAKVNNPLSASGTSDYNLDDISIGADFLTGIGIRMGGWSVRANLVYTWEELAYWSAGVSLLKEYR
jgi:hypothetical protein